MKNLAYRSVKEAALGGKRVIIRTDFDVSFRDGKIEEDFRIRANLETIQLVLHSGGRARIVAHRGRPKGKKQEAFSMRPIARRLSRLLKRKVVVVDDPFQESEYLRYDHSSDILVFENIRFWPEEEKNSVSLARGLARWGDLYVNEAFASSHRDHASMVALARLLPAYAGLHFIKEIQCLSDVFEHLKRPLVAVLGGAKLETKLPLIRRFLKEADYVLIGGALANTLLFLQGREVGKSVVDHDTVMPRAMLSDKKLCLPVDVVTTRTMKSGSGVRMTKTDNVATDEYIVDIGSETTRIFSDIAKKAGTIVWNGPLGYTEEKQSAQGTRTFAQAMAKGKAFTVVGGGDSIAVLNRYKLLKHFSFVSTGGGAMLEFLAGKKLVALEALKKFKV